MKTLKKENQNLINLILITLSTVLFFACSNSKTNENKMNSNNTPVINTVPGSQKQLASCNKVVTSDLSFNLSAGFNQSGQVDPQFVKAKFNFLSSAVTKSENIIRFFKWKISNGQPYLDQTPLTTYFYDLNSGNVTSSSQQDVKATDISATTGLYLQLNDPQASFQVIKAVVYNSTSGSIVTQANILIPQFYAQIEDYKYNSDGTLRVQSLVDLHPLKSTSTSGWSTTDFANYYQALCF